MLSIDTIHFNVDKDAGVVFSVASVDNRLECALIEKEVFVPSDDWAEEFATGDDVVPIADLVDLVILARKAIDWAEDDNA